MNRKQNLEVFAKTPVRKAVLLQIVPAVASQMVTLVYNLADTYFVGMLNAPHETAAVTVAYPSFLMLTAISNLFGVGGASAIARALGRQDEEGARRIAAVSLAGGLLSALLFSAVFRLLADPVLHLCGATEATYAAAYGYAKWVVILGGPFTILNTLLANLVRAEGGAGAAAFGVSFGGVLNILLDPLFVLPQFLGLGAVGCAVLGNRELTVGAVDEVELSRGFFNYTEKYTLQTSAIHCPARIAPQKAAEIRETAKVLYRALGCRGFARVDLFLTPWGEIVFNEVNTIPGFTPHSRYPAMMRAAGIPFRELVSRLIQLGAEL